MSVGTLTGELRRPPAAPELVSRAEGLGAPVVAGVVALTAAAAVLRFALIGHQGFWFDEANTALLVHFSPGKMLGLIPKTESTPPLYYCVAWVWARVFGSGEVGLRSLSAVAGVATVPLAFGGGSKLISRRAGLIAAAATAVNPLLIWYSQEARSYSLLVALSAGSLLAFAYARERPTPRALTAWVLVSALALATHYYALLAIVPQGVWLLVIHHRRRSALAAVGIVGLCGAGLIPLALSQSGTGRTTWIANASLSLRLGQLIPQFVDGFPSPAQAVLEPIAIVLVVLSALALVFRSDPIQRRGALLAGALALCGLLLNLLVIAAGTDDLITRNVLALWPPAAVFVAGGLAARRAMLGGLVATVLLCAIGLAGAVGIAVDRNYQRPDWRGPARLLGARPSAGSAGRAIFIQQYRDLLPLSLYLPQLKSMPKGGARVSELDIVSFTSPPSGGFCWWGSACNLAGSAMQVPYRVAGFHLLWIRHAYQFTVMRLAADHPLVLAPRALRKAVRTTSFRRDELLFQR